MIIACGSSINADNDWIHIFMKGHNVVTSPLTEVDSILYEAEPEGAISIGDSENIEEDHSIEDMDSSAHEVIVYDRLAISRKGELEELKIGDIDSIIISTNVPSIYIEIEDGKEVTSKEEYLNAKICIKGYGEYEDFDETDVKIKGRGNSTWRLPKKPYRLKFSKKQSLLGMTKAKNYVLIANQLDHTLMMNAIAYEMARRLEMPFTNHVIPVNLYVNGKYRGSYTLTEKVGINAASINIDEATGVFIELDATFDEDYKFYSKRFNLPVMIKDPDLGELAESTEGRLTPEALLEHWRMNFEEFEESIGRIDADSIVTPSGRKGYFDRESLIKYLIVNNICGNHDICHPRSTYIYKEHEDSLYHFGPVWDFDWGFNSSAFTEDYARTSVVFWNPEQPGALFFKALMSDSTIMAEYEREWIRFRDEIFPGILDFVDEYMKLIHVSAMQNAGVWPAGLYMGWNMPTTADIYHHADVLKRWLINRRNYIDKAKNFCLFDNPVIRKYGTSLLTLERSGTDGAGDRGETGRDGEDGSISEESTGDEE